MSGEEGDYLFCRDANPWLLPHKRASVEGYVKHVYCEGSRDHVLSYEGWADSMGGTFAVTRCSVKNCIVNHEAERAIAEHRAPTPDPKASEA